jgi:hypothetical protein
VVSAIDGVVTGQRLRLRAEDSGAAEVDLVE